MASRAVSPGGALLRSSRLFSLPPPLRAPQSDNPGGLAYNSESATAPFPTIQAVTTPPSSRNRGDWGFKRALPRKSIAATTTPVVRVKQVDSIEHVTDFASAADHTLSLQKWHEMNMPLTVPTSMNNRLTKSAKSVFDEDRDFTAITPRQQEAAADKRWKFKGPWLADITEGDFQKYLKRNVRTRRSEFRDFLRGKLAAERNHIAEEKARDAGEEAPAALTPGDITDADLTEYLRKLRVDSSRSELYNMAGKFLDLAPLAPPGAYDILGKVSALGRGDFLTVSPPSTLYAQTGPPSTHPSVGLSYLRTDAYLDNHPVYGPQKSHPPVEARFITPRKSSSYPAVGVGGFISELPSGTYTQRRRKPGVELLDPSVAGGHKDHVHPDFARVDSKGRIILRSAPVEGDDESVAVQKELAGKESIFGQPPPKSRTATPSQPKSSTVYSVNRTPGNTIIGSSKSYGLGASSTSLQGNNTRD